MISARAALVGDKPCIDENQYAFKQVALEALIYRYFYLATSAQHPSIFFSKSENVNRMLAKRRKLLITDFYQRTEKLIVRDY